MDDNDRELLQHLFAVATEFAEAAHDTSANGQSGHLIAQEYAELAHQLQTTALQIITLAEAATVIATQWAKMADPAS